MKRVVGPRNSANQMSVASLQRALRKGEIVPYFQPLVVLRSGQLAGFEILARWKHPELGMVPPDRFIPLAEKKGLIDLLTREILERAFAAVSSFAQPFTLSINISPIQLRTQVLPELIRSAAALSGFSLERLVVEITENALIDNVEGALYIAKELKALGCKISLDDFGTGYSSLLHLQSLPFDELKVDRSFVSSMVEKKESRKIVAAVVGLGESLDLRTVAEGIETQDQAEMLLRLGCELGQGWLFGKPIPAEALAQVLSEPRQTLSEKSPHPRQKDAAFKLDITPAQRLTQLQAVYNGAPVGLAFLDRNLRYINLNQKLAEMNGASIESHLGRTVSDMVPELFAQVEPLLRRALGGEKIADVDVYLPSSGLIRTVCYEPALDEAGEVVGVSAATLDITDSRRAAETLLKQEAYHRSIVDLDPRVLWITDPQGRNLEVGRPADTTAGRLKLGKSFRGWLDGLHPDDLQKTIRAVAESRRSGSPIDVEYRIATEDGEWRWMHARGAPRFDQSGNIVCWYGISENLDRPNRGEDAPVEDAQKRTASALPDPPSGAADEPALPPLLRDAATPDALDLVVNPFDGLESQDRELGRVKALHDLDLLDTAPEAEFDDLVQLASEICSAPISMVSLLDTHRQWFKASVGLGVRETPLEGSFCVQAVRQKGLFVVEDPLNDVRFQDSPLVLGEPNIRFYAGLPLYAEEGIAVGTLCVIDTVPRALTPGQGKALTILANQVQARMQLRSEQKKLVKALVYNSELAATLETNNKALSEANLALERLATTDVLTGLLNRRAFEERIAIEISGARRKKRSMCLLAIDIDDFKKRNDEFGHAAGDDALRHMGETLRRVLRAGDYAARTGGEEFAVILPETSSEQAHSIADRMRTLLGTGGFGFPCMTVSIGIASLRSTATDWEMLWSQADHAMYKAKRSGKNAVVEYEEGDAYLARGYGGAEGVLREENLIPVTVQA